MPTVVHIRVYISPGLIPQAVHLSRFDTSGCGTPPYVHTSGCGTLPYVHTSVCTTVGIPGVYNGGYPWCVQRWDEGLLASLQRWDEGLLASLQR